MLRTVLFASFRFEARIYRGQIAKLFVSGDCKLTVVDIFSIMISNANLLKIGVLE